MRRNNVHIGRRYKLATGGQHVRVLRFQGEWIHVRHISKKGSVAMDFKGSSFIVRAHALKQIRHRRKPR